MDEHRDEAHEHGGGMPMGSRGVTRPMAEHDLQQHHEEHHSEGHGEPYSDARYQMLRMHHKQTLWIYWTLIMLGAWTALAPFNFGYLNEALWVDPSGGRGVWFGDQTHTALRAWLMTWSDVLSGILLIILGWRSLRPDRPISLWLAAGIGAWLSAAPVFLWAFHLAGSLVVVTSVIAMGEPFRIGRYLNVLLGLILATGPWVLDGADIAAQIAGTIAGVTIIGLSLPRGPVRERFGSWDKLVR